MSHTNGFDLNTSLQQSNRFIGLNSKSLSILPNKDPRVVCCSIKSTAGETVIPHCTVGKLPHANGVSVLATVRAQPQTGPPSKYIERTVWG